MNEPNNPLRRTQGNPQFMDARSACSERLTPYARCLKDCSSTWALTIGQRGPMLAFPSTACSTATLTIGPLHTELSRNDLLAQRSSSQGFSAPLAHESMGAT